MMKENENVMRLISQKYGLVSSGNKTEGEDDGFDLRMLKQDFDE